MFDLMMARSMMNDGINAFDEVAAVKAILEEYDEYSDSNRARAEIYDEAKGFIKDMLLDERVITPLDIENVFGSTNFDFPVKAHITVIEGTVIFIPDVEYGVVKVTLENLQKGFIKWVQAFNFDKLLDIEVWMRNVDGEFGNWQHPYCGLATLYSFIYVYTRKTGKEYNTRATMASLIIDAYLPILNADLEAIKEEGMYI